MRTKDKLFIEYLRKKYVLIVWLKYSGLLIKNQDTNSQSFIIIIRK